MGEASNNPQSISLWPVNDKVPLSRDAFERDQRSKITGRSDQLAA